MKELASYIDSVDNVLQALGQLRMKGTCPTLLCVPDILVFRRRQLDANTEGDRERYDEPRPLSMLDGHACISALTAAYPDVRTHFVNNE